MRRRNFIGLGGLLILGFGAVGLLTGCGPGNIAEPASPVVSPESEAAKKAREQDEKLKELRAKEEAKFRKRKKGLPEEG